MDKDVIISYCVTVCNELEELTRLLNFLQQHMHPDDEILIQYDEGGVTDEVKDYLAIVSQLNKNHKVVGFPLDNHFANFKNNLKKHASGLFMFQLDADEIPHHYLVSALRDMIEMNKDVDLFFVPRINTVEGITQQHVDKWHWKVTKIESMVTEREMEAGSDEYNFLKSKDFIIDETETEAGLTKVKYYEPIVNPPDVQTRLYRKTSEIEWEGKVHELIKGYSNMSVFPYETQYCLYHPKKIDKQEKQNAYYETLM